MPNLTESDYKKMSIDQSFKAYKRDGLRVMYRIKLDNENYYHQRRIITKILKLDENNQYGFTMTKPVLTGCIKEHLAPSWLKFNLLLETVDLDDKIQHLFVVDIEFDEKRATEREYMYNEIPPPFIEKQKILEANERKSYCCTAKSHATLFPKKFIPLYLEDLTFLILRCCWRVRKFIHTIC